MDDIAANIRANTSTKYFSEFDFLADLYTLTSLRERESHFDYFTMLFDLFTFQMGARFLSISEDGLAIPRIYLFGTHADNLLTAVPEPATNLTCHYKDDINHIQHGYTPSPVTTINGIPAIEFLLGRR